MLDSHDKGSLEYWNEHNTNVDNIHGFDSKGSTFGLVFLLVIIMGMGFYIGSFYWDREPTPEIDKKRRLSETEHDDYHDYPIAFDKNLG